MIQVPPSIAQPVPTQQMPVATCHQNQNSQWGPDDQYPYDAAHPEAEIRANYHTIQRKHLKGKKSLPATIAKAI